MQTMQEGLAVSIYAALINKQLSEEERAQVIANGFEQLEMRYPRLQDVATQQELKNTELKLTKEIGQVRVALTKDIEQVRSDLTKDIEQVRSDLTRDIEQLRSDLSMEIQKVRSDLTKDIKNLEIKLTEKIHHTKVSLVQWMIGLLVGQSAVILGVIALLVKVQ